MSISEAHQTVQCQYAWAVLLFLGVWKNFIHIKKKTLHKNKAGKQNTIQQQKKNYI